MRIHQNICPVALLMLFPLLAAAAADAQLDVIVPWEAEGYRYKVVELGDEEGFEAVGFDDSSFATGQAAFGSPVGRGDVCPLNATIHTEWLPDTDLLLRKTISLCGGVHSLRVNLAVDNGALVFVNGVEVTQGFVFFAGCAFRGQLVVDVPDDLIVRGENLIAVRARDLGAVALFDMEVLGDLSQSRCDIQVDIDIKPGSFPNSINPKSAGVIPVAILSSPEFDAPNSVDVDTLTFGREGTESSLARCGLNGEDVDGDDLLDLVCHFFTRKTGFRAGDTVGILMGQTLDGTPIVGGDSVRIVPPGR